MISSFDFTRGLQLLKNWNKASTRHKDKDDNMPKSNMNRLLSLKAHPPGFTEKAGTRLSLPHNELIVKNTYLPSYF